MTRSLRVSHWALLTVLLYGAACAVLTCPLLLLAFSWGKDPPRTEDLYEIYGSGIYWLIIDLLMLLQSLFLLLPIEVARERPVPRRRWLVVAVAAALMMGVLFGGLACAVGEAIYLGDFIEPQPWGNYRGFLPWALLALVAGWACWAIVFVRYTYSKNPQSSCHLLVRWLLTGSVAELLVAIPCHVYVRGKEYCCAGIPTAIGLMAGSAVLLFAFGPGVLFLFVARARRLRGKVQEAAAATQAKDKTKRRTPYARDTAVWLGVALGAMVLAAVNRAYSTGVPGWVSDDASLRSVLCFMAFWAFVFLAVWRMWGAVRQAEPPSLGPQAKMALARYSPYARDAAVWLSVALGFLALTATRRFLVDWHDAAVFTIVCAVAFVVLACMAVWRASCAFSEDEPRWFDMAIVLLAVSAGLLVALNWWPEYVKISRG